MDNDVSQKIGSLIEAELPIKDREKYLDILTNRIEGNIKLNSKFINIMLLCILAFPLLVSSKISEISLGPFKLVEDSIIVLLIPTVFTFIHYRYMSVWANITQQKEIYKYLTSNIFSINTNSLLNYNISLQSFTESAILNHIRGGSRFLIKTMAFIWLLMLFIVFVIPYAFGIYGVCILYTKLEFNSVINWLSFVIPIFLMLGTLIATVQCLLEDVGILNKNLIEFGDVPK
ncbi:hypothetical protein GCM10011344_27220 [Dokdonia pacifica]|uniref:Uncharacterized protein n=1 Tax=Dokdonia pacifica TaxID=1627892 RepID=A0A239E615_9FLAO|nr:hypothetical protein [Dokdonia pacifica]GGG25109.1 hypothetical protein GCM10011344_27220 [Dokdonia pacifica]SNS40077.1 hypothetical protein SAMN06265376_11422 [Dokdonia pacifica]